MWMNEEVLKSDCKAKQAVYKSYIYWRLYESISKALEAKPTKMS